MSSGEQGPRWFHPTSPSSIFLVFLIHSPCHPWVLGGERERTGQAPGKRGVERASGPRREGPSARVSLSLALFLSCVCVSPEPFVSRPPRLWPCSSAFSTCRSTYLPISFLGPFDGASISI